jgi:ATP-dependent DNA helicase RecG
MNEKGFEFILRTGESFFAEFKEDVDKSLAKEIVAFSNSQGGRIFIGVTDSGEIKHQLLHPFIQWTKKISAF